MKDHNLIRSLQYLEDTGRTLLTEVRGRNRNLGDHDGEFDTWYKFYREMIPHLIGYAAQQQNEYIHELVNKYRQQYTQLEETLTPVEHTSFMKLLANVFGKRNTLSREEQARLLEDISNNVGNLLYQVKINAG